MNKTIIKNNYLQGENKVVRTESILFSDSRETNHHVAKTCPVFRQENDVQTATTYHKCIVHSYRYPRFRYVRH